MLTPEENAAHRTYYAGFMQQCSNYKVLLAAAGLPLSVEENEIATAYRQQLFDGLLKADKGLRARFELCRTDEARAKFIVDTINLDGHDVVDDAAAALKSIRTAWTQIERNDFGGIPLASFASSHNLDFGDLLDARTISWAGYEHVLAHFEAMAAALTPWLCIVRKTMQSGASMQQASMHLADFFTVDGGGMASDPVKVNIKVLHGRMKSQKFDQHCPRS